MKRSYIYLLLCLCIISCNSQENQAYKDAIASNSIAALRSYLISYDGNMSKKHLKKAESTLDALVSDSVIYNEFLTAEDTIQIYNICKEYQEQKISGPHSTELKTFEVNQRDYYYKMEKQRFEEIDNMEPSFRSYNLHLKFIDEFPYGKNVGTAKGFIEHNKNAHQQILSQLQDLKKAFANYKFDGYDITGPNEYGEGEFSKTKGRYLLYLDPSYECNDYSKTLTLYYYVSFKGNYYIDDDLLIHTDIIEAADSLIVLLGTHNSRTRSFDYKDMSDNEEFFSKIMKSSYQLRSNYEKTFKNPDEHHFVCKLIKYSNGNYTLRMQEKGKDMEYYDGILK